MGNVIDAPQLSLPDEVRYSTMMKELNSLKEEVRSLKRDLCALHRTKTCSRAVSSCHIYVRTLIPIASEADLSSLIQCPIFKATKVCFSWKVKILRDCLYTALFFTFALTSASGKIMQECNLHCMHLKIITLLQNHLIPSELWLGTV